jgi:hypothetical protein
MIQNFNYWRRDPEIATPASPGFGSLRRFIEGFRRDLSQRC